MNKIYIFITLFLLFASSAFATEFAILNANTTLWADITDGSSFYASTGANITITTPNGTEVVSNTAMSPYATGIYSYSHNFTELNNWFVQVTFFNGTGNLTNTIALATSSVSVVEEERGKEEMTEWMLFVILGFLITVTGQYIKNWALVIASGIWFLGLSVTALVGITTIGFSLTLFFAILGIALIWHGIGNFFELKQPTTVRANDD